MKIRVGYELIYDFPQSTPMIMVLGIHFTRASERRARVARRAQGLAHDAHRANTWAANIHSHRNGRMPRARCLPLNL
jgi:hypothetical protein